ncbi:MAG: DNA alkylation repair protein [Bacteroidetes bacterium]|nr:MAG: DNA alkylation repair protein [Bacteroidota bacterium]
MLIETLEARLEEARDDDNAYHMARYMRNLFPFYGIKTPKRALELVESLIITNSWWDSVDYLAPRIAGKLFSRFPEQIERYTSRWIESDNFWLQRSAIIFQLAYKTKTDSALLFAYVERRKDSKEFFIQKAIGWALRQYARSAPQAVRDFVNHTDLAPLSRREALKHL